MNFFSNSAIGMVLLLVGLPLAAIFTAVIVILIMMTIKVAGAL